jgi:uroporphyrin-III C-methyltransferase
LGNNRNNGTNYPDAFSSQSSATVVVLMGMSKLNENVLFFKEAKGEKPVAIIQNGTTPEEKIGLGTINSIEQVVLNKIKFSCY